MPRWSGPLAAALGLVWLAVYYVSPTVLGVFGTWNVLIGFLLIFLGIVLLILSAVRR
ncbi:cell division protein CrgA [Nonomuraea sediminis]|uniref:cell division protein CrgA n=1 Tax=Nonomuraea sediminis TaxID=2835864 RepID=UPI001BDCC18E|nr:cell division protein CrgA [Nonomuraea sediminis]